MSVSVVFNGSTYSIPETGETGWSSLTDYLVALSNASVSTQLKQSARIVTTNTTITGTDFTILCNAPSLTITLPSGVKGVVYGIFDKTGNPGTHTINTTSSQLIDASLTHTILSAYGGVLVQFDGVIWKVLATYDRDQRYIDSVNALNASVCDAAIAPKLTNFSTVTPGQSATFTFSGSGAIEFEILVGLTGYIKVLTSYSSANISIVSDAAGLQLVPTFGIVKSANSGAVSISNDTAGSLPVSVVSKSSRVSATPWV